MRLICHIGSGKTGTTSIQKYFKQFYQKNLNQHVLYLGMCFDYPDRDKEWKLRPWGYISLNENASSVLFEEFKYYLEIAESKNIDTMVICNEAFFESPVIITEFLSKVRDIGVEVEVFCYIRNYSDWSFSAYEQWGIKHKNYTGPIKPYKVFYNLKQFGFYEKINLFLKLNGCSFFLRNYSMVTDVVSDFLAISSIKALNEEKNLRVNESKDKSKLLYHLLYNDSFFKVKREVDFNREIMSKISLGESLSDLSNRLMPKSDDVSQLIKANEEEINKINDILGDGQELSSSWVDNSLPTFSGINLVNENVILDILKLIFKQQSELETLKENLSDAASAFRDHAIFMEKHDISKSLQLMLMAQSLRPNGGVINNKIDEYRKKLRIEN